MRHADDQTTAGGGVHGLRLDADAPGAQAEAPKTLADFKRRLSAGAALMLTAFETREDGGQWHTAPHKYLGQTRIAEHVGSEYVTLAPGGSRLSFARADSWRWRVTPHGVEAMQTVEDGDPGREYGTRLTYLVI